MRNPAPQIRPFESPLAPNAVKTSILLVDDRPEDLAAMELVLADLGQNLLKAGSGMEALKFAAEQDVAAVLLDLRMPGLDGIETAALLRKQERSKRVPILFVTAADPSPLQLAEAYSVGAVDFVPKPLDADILRSKVAAFVALAQSHGELQRRAGEAVRSAEERQRFLAEAGKALSSSLDYESTLSTVARLAIGALSDWCTIHLREDGDSLRLVAAEHADPARRQAMRDYWARYPADSAHRSSVAAVLDSGRSLFVPLLGPAQMDAAAMDQAHLALIRDAQAASLMIVPLKLRDRALGTVTFVRGRDSRPYDAADLSAAEDLAARASLAIENARLYREAEREIEVRKRAEDDIRVLNADLERRVEERTRALQETLSELDGFVQAVSHDLKTPIRAVLSLSQLLLEEHGGTLDSAARQHLQRIAETGLRMNRLVGDLLTLSRLGKTPLKLRPVELERAVEDALRNLALEIEESRARISVRSPLPLVLGQQIPLIQAITNLVSNALKFVPTGTAPLITIGAQEREGRIRLGVEDRGIGIAPEDQGLLFKAFARLGSEQRFPGTGLGLLIVRKAVERMGGSAGVESAAGKGSTFWIELPSAGTTSLTEEPGGCR